MLALLLVERLTHNVLLAGLAFSIGFIALTLARSELFTENFLVPVAAVVAKRNSLRSLGRLGAATIVMNLAGGWLVTAIVIAGFPSLPGHRARRCPRLSRAGHHLVCLRAGTTSTPAVT